jgi:hypothetical protein
VATPVRINISMNEAQLARLRADLSPQQVKQAQFQAIKRTTAFAAREVQDVVKAETYINTKYVRRVVTSKVSKSDSPFGTVTISQRLVPLIAYRVTASKRGGVTAYLAKNRAPIRLRHAFKRRVFSAEQAAQGDTGHVGIFLRARHLPTKGRNVGNRRLKITRRGFAGRLAIEEQFGPSVLNLVEQPKLLGAITDEVTVQLEKNTQSQLDRFLK